MNIFGGLQGTSGWSQGGSQGIGESWGSSASYGYSDSASDAFGDSWSQQVSDAYSRTYGAQASAQDVINAAKANEIQRDMWTLQAAYNAKEAERNRQYQAEMSNTAYQRAVRDLKAAGLNPILAVQNMGASTPTGGAANAGLASAHKAQAYADSESRSTGRGSSGSHNESKSRGKSENWSNSSSYSYNQSMGWEMAQSTNNIKEVAQKAMDSMSALGTVAAAANIFTSPNSANSVLINKAKSLLTNTPNSYQKNKATTVTSKTGKTFKAGSAKV